MAVCLYQTNNNNKLGFKIIAITAIFKNGRLI